MGRDNFVAPYPVDVLGDVLGGPKATQDMDIRRELAWDYGQLGSDANTAIEHTVAIKKSERRASEAIIEAGQHLIAMKGMLNHGQWGDWLATEFSMTDRTAQRMMQVAGKFNGKSDKLSDLKPSILYMLAADNVPDTAREQVIQEAQQTRPTIRRVREVIEQHSPHPVTPAKTVYTPVTIAGGSEPQAGTPIPLRADNAREYQTVTQLVEEVKTCVKPHYTGTGLTRFQIADDMRQNSNTRSGDFWDFACRQTANFRPLDMALAISQAAYQVSIWGVDFDPAVAHADETVGGAAPVITLDELEVVDSVTVAVRTPVDDEEVTHPLDCYDDDETPDVYEGFTETDQETFDRLKWPRRMRDLHELKMWLKETATGKAKEYRKLTGREVPAALGATLDHMIAVLKETMDAVEQEAVANANQ